MRNETELHTLIPLADFKAVLGIDDREDALSHYCLIIAAYCLPDEGIHEDIPFSLVLRPPYRLAREEMGIKVRYVLNLTHNSGYDYTAPPRRVTAKSKKSKK
jgi:hypothetical protein